MGATGNAADMQRLGRLAALLASDALRPLDRLPASGMCPAGPELTVAVRCLHCFKSCRPQATVPLHMASTIAQACWACQARRPHRCGTAAVLTAPCTVPCCSLVCIQHMVCSFRCCHFPKCTGLKGHLSTVAATAVPTAAAAAAAAMRMPAR